MKLVYKYLPIERKSYLTDELLRITQPADLNDPFESHSFYDPYSPKVAVGEAFTAANNDSAQAARILAGGPVRAFQAYDAYMKKANETLGVLSFSNRWDNTTMWAHYASEHRGYCVGFDRDDPIFDESHKTGDFRDITYISHKLPCRLHEGDTPEIKYFLFFKSSDWAYEQEVRLVRKLCESDKSKDAKEDSISGLRVHLSRIHFTAVQEIMIGYHCKDELREAIYSFARAHNTAVFEMQPSGYYASEFAMKRDRLPHDMPIR